MPKEEQLNFHEDDAGLVRSLLDKDRRAFDHFFATYFARLYRFARLRLDDDSACEDVVQEALIKAVRNLHTYRGEASLFTWLCQICRNEMHNWYARTGKKLAMQDSFEDNDSVRAALESLSTEDVAERAGLKQIVTLTLDHLPDHYGTVLELKYLEGLSVTEIAARLQTGEVTVQSLLARARRAFRGSFAELERELS